MCCLWIEAACLRGESGVRVTARSPQYVRDKSNFLADRAALQWIKQIVSEKISNQQALLLMMDGGDREALLMRDRVIYRLDRFREKVEAADGSSVVECAPQLRGWEGAASKAYFDAYSAFLPEDFRFSCRSQHPALDPVNALLNYGYGILYGRIEGELIKTGIDPYVGVLHRDNYYIGDRRVAAHRPSATL